MTMAVAEDHRRRARSPGMAERLVNAFGLVLLLVLGTFVLSSLVRFHGWGAVGIVAMGSLSATVALRSARARHSVAIWARRFALLAVVIAVAGAIAGGRVFFGSGAAILCALLTVAGFAVLRAVVTEQRVGFRTILGAVSVYLILGLLFAFLYVATEQAQNTPFFGVGTHVETGDFPFFSMTTLTTTGYGNLVPGGQPGKMFASLEMLMGQIFLVTLIARLVSMWEPGKWLKTGAGLADDEPQEQRP